MKHSFIFLLAVSIFTLSCNESTETENEIDHQDSVTNITPPVISPSSSVACYVGRVGKDTMKLSLTLSGNDAHGDLVYKRNEKDNNTGNLSGKLSGDTLLADYTFMSEGKQSVRQVIFLIKDSTAIEGYGDVEDRNGKMFIKDPSKVPFEKGQVLHQVPCGL